MTIAWRPTADLVILGVLAVALAGCAMEGEGEGGDVSTSSSETAEVEAPPVDTADSSGAAEVDAGLPTARLGGSVVGADVGLVLANAGEEIALSRDGIFIFFRPITVGRGYAITVTQEPPGTSCLVRSGEGTMTVDDATSAVVVCQVRSNDGPTNAPPSSERARGAREVQVLQM